MFDNYRWVAMLDPFELADGRDRSDGLAEPVEIQQVRELNHHGRPAWEALLRTTAAYDPLCSCCPLLFGAHSEQRESEYGGTTLRDREPQLGYPDAYRVRLDVATGVCVFTEEVGGSYPGTGHDMLIEVVDDDPPDELFHPKPHSRWRRRPS